MKISLSFVIVFTLFLSSCGGGGGSSSNSAPTASDVSIIDTNGGSLAVGDSLSGDYTYTDVDNDSEGTSTFRWLRDGSTIGGATSSSYTLVTADLGTSITFEITPIAAVGTTTGDTVISDAVAIPEDITSFFVKKNETFTIGTYDTSGHAVGVTLSPDGNTAYVADESAGLKIIDITTPASPALIATYNTFGHAVGVTLSPDGNTAYVADESAGLQIIDITTPASPALIATYDTSSYAYGVTLSTDGYTAYVADGSAGLQIIDISTPASPTLIATYDTPGWAIGVTLSTDGYTAYVADHSAGLQIIDITTPASPALIATYDTSDDAYDVTISADGYTAYVADGYTDLQIIDLTVNSQYEPAGFGSDTISLLIHNSTQTTFDLSISTDRSDIITIGSYDTELTSDEYEGIDIDIPVFSLSGTGTTIITLTLSHDNASFVRTVYYNVY